MVDGSVANAFQPGCLLVDDREENLFAHEALLRDTGAHICMARCADEALELLLQRDFAVALIDVQMPGMDGIELAEMMRGIERTRSVPIIFVTAAQHDESKVLRAYTNGGAVDFITKPVTPEVVRTKVRVFLDLAYRQREMQNDLERIERALEEAESSRRAVDETHLLRDHLLAVVGHDLRTPLSAITLTARVIARQSTCPGIGPRVDRIMRSAGRMADMIEEMVDASRAQTGFPVHASEHDLGALCRAVIAEVEAVHAESVIVLDAPPGAAAQLDGRAFAQALSNLVTNAVVHGDGSTVTVSVRTDAGGAALVDVHNGGAPIDEAVLPHVFEPYRRGVPREGRRGLGLGLFIAREIVRAHGGTIEVRSNAVEGTRFRVRLPARAS